MKKLLLALFFVSLGYSCSDKGDTQRTMEETEPTVQSATFTCGFAGSTASRVATVAVDIPEKGSVKKLSMYNKQAQEVYYINNPETGQHILYNHGGCEGTVPKGQYYFVFTMTDNSKIVTEGYPK